jgi:hypothetical protein
MIGIGTRLPLHTLKALAANKNLEPSAGCTIFVLQNIIAFAMRTNRPPRHLIFAILILPFLALACQSSEDKAMKPANKPSASASLPVPDGTDLTFYPGKGFGSISMETGREDLQRLYGDKYVTEMPVYLQEGEYAPGLVVFPGTTEAVEIILAGDGEPAYARISAPGSRWKTAEGLGVGASLAELEKANGRPFTFQGFEGDMSGMVIDWLGGKFYIGVSVRLAAEGKIPDTFKGNVIFRSDDPEVRKLPLRVVEIMQRLDAATLDYH